MIKKFLMVMLMQVLVISVGCARIRTSEEVIADVNKTLDSIKTYSATLNVTMSPSGMFAKMKEKGIPEPEEPIPDTKIITKVWGKVPDRLAICLEMNMPVPGQDAYLTQIKMVFDGEYQWTEAFMLQGNKVFQPKTVYKIRLKDVITPERPFDTSYCLYGSGLIAGQDLPSSIRTLMKLYDLEKVSSWKIGGVDCDVLEGKRNEAAFKELYKEHHIESVPIIEKEIGMDYIRFYFAKRDHFIRKYEIGTDLANPAFTVVFSEIRINPELPEDAFVYRPPEGIEVEDITEAVIEQRKTKEMMGKEEGITPETIPASGQWGIRLIYYENDKLGKYLSQRMTAWLEKHNVTNVFIRRESIQGKERICVYAGPYTSKEEAEKDLPILKAKHQAFKGCDLIKFK